VIQPHLFATRSPPSTTPAKPPLQFDRCPAHVPVDPAAAPFLQWAGGKRQIQDEILARLPTSIRGTYFEPCLGAGAIFYALAAADRLRGPVVLADANPVLVAATQGIQRHVEAVIARLLEHESSYRKDAERVFYDLRNTFNALDKTNLIETAALLIFLNRTCVNGLYRVGQKKGEFNTSWCRNPRAGIVNADRLRACARVLQGVHLFCADFAEVLALARNGDVVYVDPPYAPVSKTADFTSYTSDGFSDKDQVRLAEEVRRLFGKGVHVLASNADVPRVRELYDGIGMDVVMARRAMNSDGAKRGAVRELLIGSSCGGTEPGAAED